MNCPYQESEIFREWRGGGGLNLMATPLSRVNPKFRKEMTVLLSYRDLILGDLQLDTFDSSLYHKPSIHHHNSSQISTQQTPVKSMTFT